MRKTLHTPEHAHLLNLLVNVRREAGLTQQALAARLKRPQSFVAKIENGERRIDVVEFLTLAQALNMEPVALLKRFMQALESQA